MAEKWMFGFKQCQCVSDYYYYCGAPPVSVAVRHKSTSMAASLINLARSIGMALSVEASSNLGIEQVPWQLPYVDCWAKHWALQAAVSLRLCQADGRGPWDLSFEPQDWSKCLEPTINIHLYFQILIKL